MPTTSNYCYGCMEELTSYPCPGCGYSPQYGTASYALQPGTILQGRYLIGRVLGQGGFGITYMGMDLHLQRKVAIKEYYPARFVSRKSGSSEVIWYSGEDALNARQEGLEMVLKEARKISKASHIGSVVQVFNIFQENRTAYICMDYVEGQTLQQKLKTGGPLSWDAAKSLFFPVLHAMEQVHRLGLIHRDLSPDNLMIQPDGTVKILDLGAAKDLSQNSGQTTMQVAKNGFSPLEQYMQAGNSGSWTDVYAAAASLYYALTGVRPPSAIDRVNSDPLRWDLPRLQALPPHVLNALKQAMAVHYGDRIQTMEDFLQKLQSKSAPKKRFRKQMRPAIAALAAVLCLLMVIFVRNHGNSAAGHPVSAEVLEGRISELLASCTQETYHYRNGSRMEMYYDSQDRECLRIFVDDAGKDAFTVLAEYNENGNVVERYGFEYQELLRYSIWNRNSEGKTTEILEYQANGQLAEKTTIQYDSQGREISQTCADGEGNVNCEILSVYDDAGQKTATKTEASGQHTVSVYSVDGQILESTGTDKNGKQTFCYTYTYDENGKLSGQLKYGENGSTLARTVYHYEGNLKTGYTSHSFGDSGRTFSYEYIYGPRETSFGLRCLDKETGYDTEYVRDMLSDWKYRDYTYNHSPYLSAYDVHRYDWDGKALGYEGFNEAGQLVSASVNYFDETGKKSHSELTSYQEDGTYSCTLFDSDLNIQQMEQYSSDSKLLSRTVMQYDDNNVKTGILETEYHDDGSYTRTDMNPSYRTLATATYDKAGKLIEKEEFSYDDEGLRTGSVATSYHPDGSYTVTTKKGYTEIISEKTYDASGNLIRS